MTLTLVSRGTGGGGGVTDHGALTGLADNDHPQYLLDSSASGLLNVRYARAIFDPSANAGERTIGPHGLGVVIPDKAWLCWTFYDVITDFHDGVSDLATIAIHAQTANDLRTVAALGSYNAGKHSGAFAWSNSPQVKLTAAREITATVAGVNLTVGKLAVYVIYLEGV